MFNHRERAVYSAKRKGWEELKRITRSRGLFCALHEGCKERVNMMVRPEIFCIVDKADSVCSHCSQGDSGAESKPLTRGGKKATRFSKAAQSIDEDDDDDWKAKAAAAKAEREKLKEQRQEALKKAKEQQEIEEEHKDEDGDGGVGGNAEAEGTPSKPSNRETLRRRKVEAVTRFSREETLEEDADDLVSIFEKHKESIPWVPHKKRKEQEKDIYFRLGKRQSVLKTARENMRQQGLYVAREQLLLPANVERQLQRADIRRKADQKRIGEADSMMRTQSAVFTDPKSGIEFCADDHKFLVPFEPLKERICRPSMRYDPTLPYLQYDNVVPVTVSLIFEIL